MSSTPLLHGAALPAPVFMQDHPIFLRASHSPWRCIPQKTLVLLRASVLAYIVAAGAVSVYFKLTADTEVSGFSNAFDFANISSIMVVVYHLLTFSWTFTHLYYPDPARVEGTLERSIVQALSLPQNMASQRKQFYFNLFYHSTTVFCFMNTAIYWFVTRGHDDAGGGDAGSESGSNGGAAAATLGAGQKIADIPFGDLFTEGWLEPFVLINLHGVNSVIMAIEAFFLSSIKRPPAIGFTLIGVVFSAGLYLAWGAAGKALVGNFPFFWMDEAEVGSKGAVAVYCTGFLLLAPTMFSTMQGLVGIREGLTHSHTHHHRRGHQSSERHEPLDPGA